MGFCGTNDRYEVKAKNVVVMWRITNFFGISKVTIADSTFAYMGFLVDI